MMERLLVVVDAFAARGGGVDVLPAVPSDRLPALRFPVTLRVDGVERPASASAVLSHVRGPLPPLARVRVEDVSLADVPRGTEIWIADASGP
jgi:hypothetical protein